MPTVSVIIPTYNRAEFLSSAVTSVLTQTFQDFEIIVVDDASSDDTSETVRGFNDDRIRYIRHEVNRGGSAARNTGIKASEGKYIAFLDDDDEWLPEKLQMQVELLEDNPPNVGGVYTGYLILDRSLRKILSQRMPSKRGDLFNELTNGNCIGTTSTPLLKRECFDRVGLFDEDLASCQDYDMWIRVSEVYHFDYIKEPLVKYYFHENNMWVNNHQALAKGKELMLKKYGQLFALDKKRLSYFYLNLGTDYCYCGRVKKGRDAFLKAISLYPFEIRHYFNLFLSFLGVSAYRRLKEIKEKLISALS